MSISFKAPENVVLKPIITVFGVGGAGGNAVNNMLEAGLQGANFVVANTDAQSLEHSKCPNKIQLGATVTRGLGAGASPEVGASAAEESAEEIRGYLEGSNMVFVTAGMGGGTGTGASPIVAKIAKELGILTVGVVTKPFDFEGGHRMKTANKGLVELQKYVDTLIVIPNQNLFRIANERTTFADAFKMADDVLHAGVRGVTDLMIMPGLINLDFADIRAVMSEMGKAMMGTGEASGEDRAVKAAEAAISNPLLDHSSMQGARGVLINITGGSDMTLFEVDSAANRIRNEVGESEANIIFGSTFNQDLHGIIRVSVVATGIDADQMMYHNKLQQEQKPHEQEFLGPTEDIVDSVVEDLLPQPAMLSESDENQPIQEEITQFELQPVIAQQATENGTQEQGTFVATTTVASTEPSKAKSSIFSKMWNSLVSNERAAPSPQTAPSYTRDTARAQPSNTGSDIQDVPAFLRKK